MGAVISGVLGGVGGINAAYDEAQAAKKEQAQLAENQKLAWEAAASAIARGYREASETRLEGGRLAAAQKVAYANSGVDPTVGTSAQTQANTKALTELDARTQENNAAAEAWGFKVHGMQYGQQAALEATRSSSRQAGHILGAAGSLAKAGGAALDYFD